ncbi:ABC transporter substrate-binding protein [Hydrogenibacillus sp. N12]|uniref:ABC transporter substrate-binding protein n=1 Tax=Hydrogenibacillus sp. N12 TaxID=2866627 RepID=UPI001C7CFA51|nr:ABC transporter substrate-binding protein [Hydrogenibacillus sp. N12]QZA32801.1 ABC transporter substrate-binding protein [Hydrogenibacillus sp. N12]
MPPIFRPRLFALLLVAVLSFAAAGCGQGGRPTGDSAPTNAAPTSQSAGAPPAETASSRPVELTFFYPVGVTGPLTEIMNGLVDEFNRTHPGIRVKPVFTGNYADNTAKIVTALKGGNPPDVVISLSQDLAYLREIDAIQPFDDLFAKTDPALRFDPQDFFPAFMLNSQMEGKTWGIPFQRSTPVMYYNKTALKEAGLDPEKPPETWDELVDAAKKTMRRENGKVARWGVEIPISGVSTWLFEALALEAGQGLYDGDPTKVFVDTPAAKRAMQWLVDLSHREGVMPEGVIDWSAASTDFTAGKTVFLYHSTGSLSAILKQANFDVGVAFLPKDKQYGVPTGGGNFYILKGIPETHKEAAWTFVQWMVSPEIAARWSIDTGYAPVRKAATETDRWKQYVAERPQAEVALKQLEYAHPEFAPYQRPQVQKIVADAIQAVLTGAATVDDAFARAQQDADRILQKVAR